VTASIKQARKTPGQEGLPGHRGPADAAKADADADGHPGPVPHTAALTVPVTAPLQGSSDAAARRSHRRQGVL